MTTERNAQGVDGLAEVMGLLPSLWRQRAEMLRGMKGGRNYRRVHGTNLAAAHVEDCADELEAALAKFPEPRP